MIHPSNFLSLTYTYIHTPLTLTLYISLLLSITFLFYQTLSLSVYTFSKVGFLMQIDKLVQLLESPIFVQLRLQLLEVDATYHAHLLKSLYGLLMLLPQSTAFRTLKDRLATVSSLQQHLGYNDNYE